MPVSPQEFSLWARMTGNKYPNSVEEKARLAPEVHNFSQNVGKQGALGVKEPTTKDPGDVNMREYTKALGDEYNSLLNQAMSSRERVSPEVSNRLKELDQHIQNSASRFPWNTPSPLDAATVRRVGATFSNEQEPEPEQKSNLGSKLAKGALIAGGIAAGVAAARNPGVQEAVKSAASKVDDFVSNFTTPRTVNVDTAEAVRDVTNSAPGDVYSQAIIPTHQQVEGYTPAGLLPGRFGTGEGKDLIAKIASKYGTNDDEPYVHPSRIPGMPGGDYRGRRFDTEAPSERLRAGRRDNETGMFTRYHETGELPPSAITPEMKAALSQSDVTNAIEQIKQKWINEHSTSKQNISGLQEGIRQEKLARGDKEISRGYFESDARRREQELARRGFNESDLPTPEDQPAPGEFSADDPRAYEQSLSNKADAVISALGAADPEFGHTQYAPPESVEAANADPSQNPINTALSGPTTPGNNVPTIQSTNDPGTLTGQHQIQIAADNAVDQLETDIIAIRRAELNAKRAQIAEGTGLSNPAIDRFLGKYFPSMTETYSDVDIASGRTPERTVPNVGPEAGVTKAASGTSIRGRSRVQDYEPSRDRQRDIIPEEEPLRGSPEPEQRPDIIGGRLPLGGIPGDLDTSEMSKQEVIQSIINPSTVDLRDKTPIAGTGVYGIERGYVSGAMKASGEYSDAAMRKPTDLSPAEAKYEKFSKDPYAGLSDEALQTHIQNARPGSPSQQGLQREAYRRSGIGIPISQKMREIHTTGDPLTRSERAQAFLDELRRNQQG